jgi:hypothetical protein
MAPKRPTDVYNGAAIEIPLSPEQLQQLGTLSAIWGQIDYLISVSLSQIMGVAPVKVEELLDKQMTGARVTHLRRQLPKIKDEAIRKTAKTFCANMESLIAKRNHITHGIWCWHVDVNTKKGRRASHFLREKDKPIFADELTGLVAKFAEEAKRIHFVHLSLIGGHPKPDEIPQFFISNGPPPDWYPELI